MNTHLSSKAASSLCLPRPYGRRHNLFLGIAVLTLFVLPSEVTQAQMIVAHRGASEDAPENTMAAFREAWRQDADGIEGDFYFTSDKQVVCIHDKDTKRTGGKNLKVAKSTLTQLRTLEFGSWKHSNFSGEPLPTLQDILKILPEDKTFVIELKTGPEIVPLVKEILREAETPLEQILIISFDDQTIAKSKELLPAARAHWLTGYKTDDATGVTTPSLAEIATTLKRCNADGLGTQANREVVTKEFIDELRQGGMEEFHVWTVDKLDDAKYFQSLGACGITTNRPGAIKEGLGSGK
ncbi:MAG: glycerophosphodiester phosphodiesterase [Planctomycetota bacterium]